MAKNVNPAMQAAPYLGDSSHNPIEFARRQNMQKFQMQRREYEEQQRNTARGLENLMLDVKGWEDQEGFKEIMADQDKILNGYMELSRKGMNLVSPKTTNEILAYKAITKAHSELKQKADTWNQQKQIYDLLRTAIIKDQALPKEEQTIDVEPTMAKATAKLKQKSIMERGMDLQDLIVTKPQIGDVDKYVKDNMGRITPPQDIEAPYKDPDTGLMGTIRKRIVTPDVEKQQIEDYRKMYRTMPEKIKQGVKVARKNDTENDPAMPDEEYFVGMYNRKFKESFKQKVSSKGGSGMSINFGGVRDYKINPGELQTNSNKIGGRNYDQRYDFETTGKLIKVPTAGGYKHDSDEYTDKKTGEYSNGWNEITGGDYAEAELLFYDPKTDELVFRTGQAAENPFIGNNVTFSVPRKNVPKAEGLPIKLPNGKIGTLKDVMGTGTTTAKVLPLRQDFWSKPKEEVYLPGSKKAGGKGKFDDL